MAIVHSSALINGISGKLGNNLILRRLRGKIVASSRPSPKSIKRQSQAQKDNRGRFKLATCYAKAMMLIPEKKAYYTRKAKKLSLPNAYTAAITDYLRKPSIAVTGIEDYQGNAGHTIKVESYRKGFRVGAVRIIIKDIDGIIHEQGQATDKNNNIDWLYKTTNTIPLTKPLIIQIQANYANINMVQKEIIINQSIKGSTMIVTNNIGTA